MRKRPLCKENGYGGVGLCCGALVPERSAKGLSFLVCESPEEACVFRAVLSQSEINESGFLKVY